MMKKIYLLLTVLLSFGVTTASALVHGNNTFSSPAAIVFSEGGIEFAVYPDGQFDFYDPQVRNSQVMINNAHISLSFNSGHNYGPYVQYDDYGAVVQVQNTPIYYDYYGKVAQIGRVNLDYNAYGKLYRVGGLYIQYNPYGNFASFRGYINTRNRGYRPHYQYYKRPIRTVVYARPYRRYYEPRRVAYRNYRKNYHGNGYHQFYSPSDRKVTYTRGTRTRSDSKSRTTNRGRSSSQHARSQQNSANRRVQTNAPKRTSSKYRKNNTHLIYDSSEKNVSEVKKLPTRRSSGHTAKQNVSNRSSQKSTSAKPRVQRSSSKRKSTNRKPDNKNLRKSRHNSNSSSSQTSGNTSRRR